MSSRVLTQYIIFENVQKKWDVITEFLQINDLVYKLIPYNISLY